MEEYIFTFGSGQELEGFYVRIKGQDYLDCRKKMCEKFGKKQGFQYSLKEWNKWTQKARTIGIPIETEILVIE